MDILFEGCQTIPIFINLNDESKKCLESNLYSKTSTSNR